MIFHKFETERGYQINEVYDDEFYTYCTQCEKEMNLDLNEIKQTLDQGGSFDSTSYKCVSCSAKNDYKKGVGMND